MYGIDPVSVARSMSTVLVFVPVSQTYARITSPFARSVLVTSGSAVENVVWVVPALQPVGLA